MKYLIYNGEIVTSEGVKAGSVAIVGERIEAVLSPDTVNDFIREHPEYQVIDVSGKWVFAGGIDAHVHFREPGMTQKADIQTESRAAVAGGVTSYIDMPNTKPATTSAKALKDKLGLAQGRSYANFGFHLGATNDNFDEIQEIIDTGKEGITSKDFGGIKVFMGSSTGNMLVNDGDTLDKIFSIRDKEVLVHCEDEKTIRENLQAAQEKFSDDIPFSMHPEIRSRRACILSSLKALETAIKHGTRLHLLHISTKEEMEMTRAAKLNNPKISAETSVNYLWFSDQDYQSMGSRVKCNPAIKTARDREALRSALKGGLVDTIGTDHAPHLLSEKERGYLTAPSGMPSIQQSLQVLLSVAEEEDIAPSVIASVFSEKTAEIFGIRDRGRLERGYFADIVIVDPKATVEIKREDMLSKCGWSPYEGQSLRGKITDVFVNGQPVIRNSAFTDNAPLGQKLIFDK